MSDKNVIRFQPQPGGQTMFLSSPAKFTLYGGAAGAGKTFAMCLATLRHYKHKNFRATTYRRHRKEHTAPGGLVDTAQNIYPLVGAKFNKSFLRWEFPSGASENYEGMATEDDKFSHKGDQNDLIKFDELTDFTESQFRYLFTRNRSACGFPTPYVMASCNPDPDSWVRSFVEWYLLPSGTPDHSKRGKIRYFANKNDHFIFGATKKILCDAYDLNPEDCHSYTYIYGTLADNKHCNTPDYIASLKMGGEAETQALLYGNWNVRRSGKMFQIVNFELFILNPPYFYLLAH